MAQGTTRGVPIDIDPLLTADSDLLVPSQKAAKSYIDNGLSNKQNDLGFTPANISSPTFTGTVTTPAIIVSSETASRVAIIDGSKNVKSADTATYPSLTELSYGKGVTSAIQTQINGKITQNTWVDYSATSTIVGWSSFTIKNIRYYVVGKIITVFYQFNGTSNSTTTTFTLPFANAGANVFYPNAYTNNGVSGVAAGRTRFLTGDSFATMAIDWANVAFSASGSKTCAGTIIYEIA